MTTADEPSNPPTSVEPSNPPTSVEWVVDSLTKLNNDFASSITAKLKFNDVKIAELEEMLSESLAKNDAKDAEIAELTKILAESKNKNAKDLAEIRSFIFRTKHVMDQVEEKRIAIYKWAAALEADTVPSKIVFV